MGEAKRRGTQEQRVQNAELKKPKKPKVSAETRHRLTRQLVLDALSKLGLK